MSASGGLSTTSFTPSSVDQSIQPQALPDSYQSSPPYAASNSLGVPVYQSLEAQGSTDIQRPPYWEGSVPATSVDSLPQHGNVPRYSAFTDVGSPPGVGGSLGSGGAPGMGGAPAPAPSVGNVVGVGSAPQGPSVVSPTWNPIGITEFGQSIMGSSSTPAEGTSCIPSVAAPDAPKGMHQGLTRLSTELASVEGRDLDAASPRSASRASVRPLRVGGPRVRPQRVPSSSGRSLPPAYEQEPHSP